MMAQKHAGNKIQRTTREVQIMFEPSRLAQNWLQRAYERVVPVPLQPSMRAPDFRTSSACVSESSKPEGGGKK